MSAVSRWLEYSASCLKARVLLTSSMLGKVLYGNALLTYSDRLEPFLRRQTQPEKRPYSIHLWQRYESWSHEFLMRWTVGGSWGSSLRGMATAQSSAGAWCSHGLNFIDVETAYKSSPDTNSLPPSFQVRMCVCVCVCVWDLLEAHNRSDPARWNSLEWPWTSQLAKDLIII